MKKEIEDRIKELKKIEADQKKTFEERVDATMQKMKLANKLKKKKMKRPSAYSEYLREKALEKVRVKQRR